MNQTELKGLLLQKDFWKVTAWQSAARKCDFWSLLKVRELGKDAGLAYEKFKDMLVQDVRLTILLKVIENSAPSSLEKIND